MFILLNSYSSSNLYLAFSAVEVLKSFDLMTLTVFKISEDLKELLCGLKLLLFTILEMKHILKLCIYEWI